MSNTSNFLRGLTYIGYMQDESLGCAVWQTVGSKYQLDDKNIFFKSKMALADHWSETQSLIQKKEAV